MIEAIVKHIEIPFMYKHDFTGFLKKKENELFREMSVKHPDYQFVEGERCDVYGRVYYRYVFEKK